MAKTKTPAPRRAGTTRGTANRTTMRPGDRAQLQRQVASQLADLQDAAPEIFADLLTLMARLARKSAQRRAARPGRRRTSL